jgi:hypothetical protein
MPFEDLTHTKISKYSGQPLSENTVKIYKQHLNRLAKEGYDTKESLLKNHKKVIKHISTIESNNIKRRLYFSSIFYALDEYPQEKQKPYYNAFLKAKSDFKTVTDSEKE